MSFESCYTLGEGEVLHEKNSKYPLFEITIYGSRLETIKISKRITCSVKHLPIRVKIHYELDTLIAIEDGIRKDPSVKLEDKFIIEGLIPAEEIEAIFKKLLASDLRK